MLKRRKTNHGDYFFLVPLRCVDAIAVIIFMHVCMYVDILNGNNTSGQTC